MDQAVPTQAPCVTWLSLAHQDLSEIPYEVILEHSCRLEALDLSYNLLVEYPLAVQCLFLKNVINNVNTI